MNEIISYCDYRMVADASELITMLMQHGTMLIVVNKDVLFVAQHVQVSFVCNPSFCFVMSEFQITINTNFQNNLDLQI